MIIEPKVRGFICTTTHPIGCRKNLEQQIDFVKSKVALNKISSKFKNVLVIGGSTGYGLSSRIVAHFGWGADSLNISLERSYSVNEKTGGVKPASPGWYQTAHLEHLAQQQGQQADSIIGDAFSDEVKQKAITYFKKKGPIDLLIYSLAAPKRFDPVNQKEYRSVLKTIGNPEKKKTLDPFTREIKEIEMTPASQEEIEGTIKVMGGEDWKRWINVLSENQLLSPHCITLAYSYIGPEVTQAIYRKGTIGKAKEHLEKTAEEINLENQSLGIKAYISMNKGLVTQASAAIPVLPLYLSILYRVMKEKELHEGCIEQMTRLFAEKLKVDENENFQIETDSNNFIRLDDWEMKSDIQEEVKKKMETINQENLSELSDIEGYRKEFINLFGFEIEGVDYQQEVTAEQLKVNLNPPD